MTLLKLKSVMSGTLIQVSDKVVIHVLPRYSAMHLQLMTTPVLGKRLREMLNTLLICRPFLAMEKLQIASMLMAFTSLLT